ncbi:MAG TPA: hypothetical protein VFU98_03885 [Microlunatus sp.]|nr:hypothetical protein [Microlunatus sp.]
MVEIAPDEEGRRRPAAVTSDPTADDGYERRPGLVNRAFLMRYSSTPAAATRARKITSTMAPNTKSPMDTP